VARSRTVVIAGGGIGGLTAALAVARKGFRVVVAEQAERLEETGAGIQLSPNATRVLHRLGLAERLRSVVVAPQAVRIRTWRGRELAEVPLGAFAESRYGAPYWVARRADLQTVLLDAVAANSDITLRLHTRVEDHAVHANGVTVQLRTVSSSDDEHGIALVGADGLWSATRKRLGDRSPPRFAHHTAWRAIIPTRPLVAEFRDRAVSLWLGPDAHLVLYPVHGGAALNIVAIVRDEWQRPGWSTAGTREELLAHYGGWPPRVHNLLALPDRWLKWALYDRLRLRGWGRGPVTLLGDAAHPMLPFLAQGAAMAIEDAHVLAEELSRLPDQPDRALRRYERARERRTARVQRAARANGRTYHLKGIGALARNWVLRGRGGKSLLRRYDWLYGWRP
jgi:2-polyprenyl-6-methoxyphenol hydroxylase-like FAD-dependent oxidoreductase